MARPPDGWARAAGLGVAALVHDTVTPSRLRPGCEKRLSLGSRVATCGAFAVGLAPSDVLAIRSTRTTRVVRPGRASFPTPRRARRVPVRRIDR